MILRLSLLCCLHTIVRARANNAGSTRYCISLTLPSLFSFVRLWSDWDTVFTQWMDPRVTHCQAERHTGHTSAGTSDVQFPPPQTQLSQIFLSMTFTLSWPHLNKLEQSIKIDNTTTCHHLPKCMHVSTSDYNSCTTEDSLWMKQACMTLNKF